MGNTNLAGLIEHALGAEHIAGGLELSTAANWNQNEADWRLFLQLGRGFGLSTEDGRLVATTMVIPFAARFAWISVVLVANDFRRRGLATHLTLAALGAIADSSGAPILDATPHGREVYRRLGFADCWLLQRLVLRAPPTVLPAAPALDGATTIRPLVDADWEAVERFDEPIFGAPRGAVLRSLGARRPEAAHVAERDGDIVGYILARDGRIADQLGPVCATSPEIGIALLASALARTRQPIFIDLPERHTALRAWLTEAGFVVGRPFSRMALGLSDTFDDHGKLLLSAGPELG